MEEDHAPKQDLSRNPTGGKRKKGAALNQLAWYNVQRFREHRDDVDGS